MGKNKKNGWKAIGVLWSGLAVLLVMSVPVFGTSPGMSGEAETESTDEPAYTAVDGNRISKEQLEDGIVEYEELGSLIHYGNLSIQEMTDSTERTRQEFQEIRDYLRAERASASAEKGEQKKIMMGKAIGNMPLWRQCIHPRLKAIMKESKSWIVMRPTKTGCLWKSS